METITMQDLLTSGQQKLAANREAKERERQEKEQERRARMGQDRNSIFELIGKQFGEQVSSCCYAFNPMETAPDDMNNWPEDDSEQIMYIHAADILPIKFIVKKSHDGWEFGSLYHNHQRGIFNVPYSYIFGEDEQQVALGWGNSSCFVNDIAVALALAYEGKNTYDHHILEAAENNRTLPDRQAEQQKRREEYAAFRIVSAESVYAIEQQVNRLIAQGYEAFGPTTIIHERDSDGAFTTFLQPMKYMGYVPF